MTREALTETKIRQLKPRTKPYKASDGTVGGLRVAVSTAGGKVFCLAYRFGEQTDTRQHRSQYCLFYNMALWFLILFEVYARAAWEQPFSQ